MRIQFDADSGGAGDLIAMVGVACGARRVGHEVCFHSTRSDFRLLLQLLGETPAEDPLAHRVGLGSVFPLYNQELALRGNPPRVSVWGSLFDPPAQWVRPPLRVPEGSLKWAREERAKRMGEAKGPFVVMFPLANFATRQWPAHYWASLANSITGRGGSTVTMVPSNRRAEVRRMPWIYWGHPWDAVAAMIAVADVVVTNDSGPGWLAATMQRPHIALVGPTRSMFTPLSVKSKELSFDGLPCVGCGFQGDAGYVPSVCNTQCAVLGALRPEIVEQQIMSAWEPSHA